MQLKDYKRKSLDNHVFSGLNLRKADFSGASLRNANFRSAWLESAVFEDADLTGADLTQAKAPRANFRNCRMPESKLDEAELEGAMFVNAEASQASFWKATLTRADLSRAQLTHANLERANLEGSILLQANLEQANLRLAKAIKADFQHAILTGSDLSRANLSGANLTLACLENVLADGTNFTRAILLSAICNGIKAAKANFTGARLRLSQFSDARLDGAKLVNCRVYGASFWNIGDPVIECHSLDLSNDEDGSLLADDVRFAPILFFIEQSGQFIDLVNALRLRTVLVLGRDVGDHLVRLRAIQQGLKKLGYVGIIAKEQSDTLSDSVMRKIATLAMLSRFVIVENSVPSGHLFELPFIRMLECVTVVMQEENKGATWMFEDMYGKYGFVTKIVYKPGELEEALADGMGWAGAKLQEHAVYHTVALPWLREHRDEVPRKQV